MDIPTVAVDPAGLRVAADSARSGAADMAEQATLVSRTWAGLTQFYAAPEAETLAAALDPVVSSADLHRTRTVTVYRALTTFADEAESVIRQLDALRAEEAANPLAAAELEQRAAMLLGMLAEAEGTCAGVISAAAATSDDTPSRPSADLDWALLLGGDHLVGGGYLQTPLEYALLTHFVEGSGAEYVLSAVDLDALRADPAVRQAADAIRSGRPVNAAPVTLEGGTPGFRVPIDFKQPVPGRAGNAFDGSIGRGQVFFDRTGNVAGISDAYDFTNGGQSVDLVNAAAGLFGAKAFHVRGGIIEEISRPGDDTPVQPDAPTAVSRTADRLSGGNPGDYTGPQDDARAERTPR
jgi:hypothetical protein